VDGDGLCIEKLLFAAEVLFVSYARRTVRCLKNPGYWPLFVFELETCTGERFQKEGKTSGTGRQVFWSSKMNSALTYTKEIPPTLTIPRFIPEPCHSSVRVHTIFRCTSNCMLTAPWRKLARFLELTVLQG